MSILSAIFYFLILAALNIDVTTSINRREDRKSFDDIHFTPRQKQQMRMRLFIKFAEKWKDGLVPYTIEEDIQKHVKHVQLIQDAIAVYNSKTCIKWIPRTNEENYVKFIDDSTKSYCYSKLGMIGNAQPISLTTGCEEVGIVLHEMMHAAGFLHEHQRPDRDEYITVHMDLIKEDMRYAFNKMNYENIQLKNTKYDYDSIMHYRQDEFNDKAITIETKDKSKQLTIGQRVAFTDCDLEKLNLMYQCKDKIKNDPKCVSNVPGVKTCYDSVDCPTATSYMMCQREPGKFNDICKSTCENCDGKKCFDTTDDNVFETVCQNDKATCDDYKKSVCPKTCGTCKAEPKTCCDDPTCPSDLLIQDCQNYPGEYLDKCRATCNNCDGKQCYDTLDEEYYRTVCQNGKECDDNKKSLCPKTCEICKPTVDATTKPPPPPPTVFFPCVDASTSSCQQSLKKNKNYCEKGTTNFAYARSSCCNTCAISKGFTMKQERKITKPNGEIITNYVIVVDLTSSAASSWAALPKVNSIYPGMNKIQTDAMCKQRARKYGTERFCADPYSRCICGETCLSYNYPI